MSCVTLHIPTVTASMLGYSLATFLWQQLLPNAVSCGIHALTGSWAVTIESLLSRKASLPWSPMLLPLLWGGHWPQQLQHLPLSAAWPSEALAAAVTGQDTGEAFLPNWAVLAAEEPHLLWGKGCGLDGSLQQAGSDVPGRPRLDLFRLYLLCLAQTLEWIQDLLCPHGHFSGPQHYRVWLLKQEKVRVRLCRLL